jgi:invasion protein IalB
VAVTIPAETKTPIMVVRLPLGIYLPAGASVQFGQDAAIPLEITRCDQSGLTISAQNRDQAPLTYLVPAEGFSAAYAKLQ